MFMEECGENVEGEKGGVWGCMLEGEIKCGDVFLRDWDVCV